MKSSERTRASRDLHAVAATHIHPPPYELGPLSLQRDGARSGEVIDGTWEDRTVYRGQIRSYRVYIPPRRPRNACLIVFQDGLLYADPDGFFRAANVLDNLIDAKEIPPTVGVFVEPTFGGSAAMAKRAGVPVRFSRGDQYDPLDDTYSRFLLDEFLPGLSKLHGLRWSEDAQRRALCGFSCGGVASFTAAWERPDAFRNVISHCGAFVNLRGADRYPSVIRRTDRKPLRVFLQTGSRDHDNVSGHGSLATQQIAAALRFKKYNYRFAFGAGRHDGLHGGVIFPETLRWVWRDVS